MSYIYFQPLIWATTNDFTISSKPIKTPKIFSINNNSSYPTSREKENKIHFSKTLIVFDSKVYF